jgi:hypothetical protein
MNQSYSLGVNQMRHFLSAAALAALLFFGMKTAMADAVWSVAGKQVLRLHATVGGKTPEKRVEMLDSRVTEILSKGDGTLGSADIVLKKEKGSVYIEVQKQVLVTVAPEDASANHTTREKLAQVWLANIRKTLPQLAPRVNKRGA